MPAQFHRSDLSFFYPDNWAVDEDEVSGGRSVTVYSPGGGFWSVAVYHDLADPSHLADAALEAMQKEYKDLEVQPVAETLAGRQMSGYDLNFFLLDFTNTAQIRSVQYDRMAYTILCQAEDREFEQMQRVFQAITVSLLNGLNDRYS